MHGGSCEGREAPIQQEVEAMQKLRKRVSSFVEGDFEEEVIKFQGLMLFHWCK